MYALEVARGRTGRQETRNRFFCGVQRGPETPLEEIQANASLIAAAPMLLSALQQIMRDMPTRRDWLDPNAEALALDAIALAEGRTTQESEG